ncbi:3-methyladenine DNA glycosylase AlkC [Rhizobium sp. RU20A]|uniref:DNA alkylation repair protein n=1 Tax=Rhizobium sp. RU20A TaxID=1907412 RepID=UPI0009565894|nr:DNA alkylation repair protein [Rhizobium sp. RU20A]SIQ29334.1 3-methyladenine DNA glycosylase AlkC [Rhizobium sp. RU20A]
MAEPLKNLIDPALVATMTTALTASSPDFDAARFTSIALADLDRLELMQRAQQVRAALEASLPADFAAAADSLERALPSGERPGLKGWALLPVNQFVALHGLDHFDRSLALLKALTPHFTAEFGIRAFIAADQKRALATIAGWVDDPDPHVRRLASEGTRPRLPWALQLKALIAEPRPILPILSALIDDPSDYVRRSVANSLNDIAKDHPDVVAEVVATHLPGASRERRQLLRHACRTLLKRGEAAILGHFGFAQTEAITATLTLGANRVRFGDSLPLTLTVENRGPVASELMIDYAVHHVKADGSLSPKVFKWTAVSLAPGETRRLERRHALRPITTRRYYPGRHAVDIRVNGAILADAEFDLDMDG